MTSRKDSENLPADLPPVPAEFSRIPFGLESHALMTRAREARASYHRHMARAVTAWILARSRAVGIRFKRPSGAASQGKRDRVSSAAPQH